MADDYLMALPKGYRLNQYEIISVLGAGGFGVTYLARDTSLDKLVAIKEYMPSDFALRAEGSRVTAKSTSLTNDFQWGLARFLDEARILAKFRHPNIVEIHQIFEANQTAYIVMEYAEGETLSQHLTRVGTLGEGGLSVVLGPILEGLQKVHGLGFLHRDIKPANIILRATGGPVLIDFGAARQAVKAMSASITSVVTEGYAPIEQYASNGNQGPWTDVYALGAVAYKCLTGETPAAATQRIRTDPMRPASAAAAGRAAPSFLAAIDWALSPNETDRPQSIADWLPALQGTVDAEKTMRARAVDATMRSAEASHAVTRTAFGQPPSGPPQPYPPQPYPPQNSYMPQTAYPQQPVSHPYPMPAPVHPHTLFGRPVKSLWPIIAGTALAVLLLGVGLWWFMEGRIPQDDRLAWAAAANTNTVDGYQAYMRMQPLGYYTDDAKQRVAGLLLAADDSAWTQASAQNTEAAYQNYMQQYPGGRHQGEAKTAAQTAAHAAVVLRAQQGLAMVGLFKGTLDGKETVETTAAVRAYEQSKSMPVDGTISDALLAALDTDNAERIRLKKEAEARELAAYNGALSRHDRATYQAFLRTYPDSSHVADVRNRLTTCHVVTRSDNVFSAEALNEKGTGRGTGNSGCELAREQATQKMAGQCQGHLGNLVTLSEDHDTTGSETGGAILGSIFSVITKRNVNVNLPSTCNVVLRGECRMSKIVQHQVDTCG